MFNYTVDKYRIDLIEIYIPDGINTDKTLKAIRKILKGKTYTISFKSSWYNESIKKFLAPVIIRLQEDLKEQLFNILDTEGIYFKQAGTWHFNPI